ncbi:hypothetical protein H6P81_015300 [Aristolochia fimbriata]|uniref:Protein TIFY n=1 Tax=Aristolochia fimbriata TaxID=158543 RepID=A0AAV7E4X0_ARIFI|nr:hypothetical protein H6P81_015300 [Aristolochia fimbriata]
MSAQLVLNADSGSLQGSEGDIIFKEYQSSRKGQLTIFYEGTMNVYENVPIDKAQAIMLLAGESATYDHRKSRVAPNDVGAPSGVRHVSVHQQLPSITELQADLPLARKHSLQCFFEKRRDRIMNMNAR